MRSKKLDEVFEKMKSDMKDKMTKDFIEYVQEEGFEEVKNSIEEDDLDLYSFEKIPDGFYDLINTIINNKEKYYDKE